MDKVLIIDDEFGPRESLRFLLKEEYEVFCTDSVDAGIAVLKETPPDIIISDIRMPGKTGIDGLKEIREIDKDVSIILLTGYGSLETAQQAIRLGANDYMKKPFDTKVMRETVAKYIRRTKAMRKKNETAMHLDKLQSEMQEAMQQKEKLAVLGQMSSEFVHDISNPLMVMFGYVELLKEEMDKSSDTTTATDVFEFIENIQQSAHRCKELLDSWKNYGKKSNTNNEDININDMIREVVASSKPVAAGKNCIIKFDENNNLYRVKGNNTQIFRALQNLVTNAIQALPDDGSGIVSINMVADGGNITIKITDNGCGIPEDKLNAIFKPYVTTRKLNGGTGLGLYITRKIIKEHNGDITIENNTDKGVTARLILPLANTASSSSSDTSEQNQEMESLISNMEEISNAGNLLKQSAFRSRTETFTAGATALSYA